MGGYSGLTGRIWAVLATGDLTGFRFAISRMES